MEEFKIAKAQTTDEITMLRDALDAISDGFILLDADDRVIAFNAKQLELFPSVAEVLAVGMPYRDLLAAQFESGQIDATLGPKNEWIDDRIRQLQFADGTPIEQIFADGRVIRLSENRTSSNGIVSIRTDVTELKLVQRQLQESAERLRDFAEASADWYWEMDADFRYTLLSSNVIEGVGVEITEFYGKTQWEMLGEEFEQQESLCFIRDCMKSRQSYRDVIFWRSHATTGERTWIRASGMPFFDGNGKFAGFRGSSTDITETRRAEGALRESEYRFRDFANAASDWFWEMGPDLRFTFYSDRFYEITGFRPEDKIGITRTQNADPDELAADEKKWRTHLAMLQARKPFSNFEYALKTRDGGYLHTRVSGLPVFTASGDFAGYRGTGSDVTEQRQAEESARRLINAVDAVEEIVLLFDADDKLLFCNEKFREINTQIPEVSVLGITFEEQIKAMLAHGLVPDAMDREDEWVRERLELHQNPKGPFEQSRQNGIVLLVHEQRLPGGGTITLATDITENKAVEAQLLQAQKMEAVGQLTGGVAHDFNNLLAIILGNLELLAEQVENNSRAAELAAKAVAATLRGADLTHRLLAFSRTQPLRPTTVDVNRLTQGMQDLLVRSLGEAIAIELVIGPGLWQCEVDPGQLENAILNLSINARDAMPEGGRLMIETSNADLSDPYAAAIEDVIPGEYVLLAISDTGTGMPPEVISRAFDPFFSTKAVGKGSGLGLSMIYGFVRQSGGHARIYSELGEGTTMKIYLPRSTADIAARPAAGSQIAANTQARGEVIMVVEDDPEVRTVAVAILDELGYEILEAGSADAALAQIDPPQRIDLFITDVILPGGMGGRQLADRAGELIPGLKILYISGYAENALMHHDRLDEGVQLLMKPFGRADLALKVHEILDRAPT